MPDTHPPASPPSEHDDVPPAPDEDERLALEAAIREADEEEGEDIPHDIVVRDVLNPMIEEARRRIEELRRRGQGGA